MGYQQAITPSASSKLKDLWEVMKSDYMVPSGMVVRMTETSGYPARIPLRLLPPRTPGEARCKVSPFAGEKARKMVRKFYQVMQTIACVLGNQKEQWFPSSKPFCYVFKMPHYPSALFCGVRSVWLRGRYGPA
jgi:hypothetical protein